MPEYKEGDTFRTDCGYGRITYHPKWSPSKPWASYSHGTAGLHFASPELAIPYFKNKGMHLDLTKKS